ncbi:DUF1415 domain-containing protein [Burkholderia thailandensis]|uniref:DUF1415 domain-containing protein n=1 Tax=Burkholderia thailandensis TaxID=57975 RepID=A0AAW9D1K2_BURTH|nr:DUF1415 domain-containing protein [Burkholderia thailandensis]AHI64822.1 hypothetical protein BTL_725 [Burkholderia thailandensis H0587]AOJ49763.1 hypothetical protein AQ475_02195 [Burkholderia thailandensis]AVR25144.1 DUF1415 domain-containing protein [Burkholderia thailandensis]MCS3392784.1 DUF1415 domain-containing protein [Burkholderia thailandensis]MCS6426012.1 DUF1415 domain-containing protein [Burkholderia thailandensis]
MTEVSPSDADIVAATRHWLTRAVIGLNLCPFAKSVHVKRQVRYAISRATSLEAALPDLENELRRLDGADPDEIDTTLLIFPNAFADFLDYNDALWFADRLLQQLRLDGTLQIASFHPHYQFEGTEPDDIENYTNRAPYPILHLLREASIERAVDAFPDAADIYTRNQATMRRLGHAGWRDWMARHGEGEGEDGDEGKEAAQ